MNNIKLDDAFGVKKSQLFLSLFIGSKTIIFCSKPSVCQSQVDNFIHYTSKLIHRCIYILLHCSKFSSNVTKKPVIVRVGIVVTLGFAAETNLPVQLNFCLKSPGSCLKCFLSFEQHLLVHKFCEPSVLKE